MAEHNSLGIWGENIVTEYLIKEGYAIEARNWRSNHHEIDIIATKGNTIAFVEVKTRGLCGGDPLTAMTRSKIRFLVNAANAYLRGMRHPMRPRFDVAAIKGDPHNYTLNYIVDAFYPPLRTYHSSRVNVKSRSLIATKR
jgi:putative endonuclease